jgi:hypothetical protein
MTWSSFQHSLDHLLDLLLIQADQLPIAVDNGTLGLDAGDGFTLDGQRL